MIDLCSAGSGASPSVAVEDPVAEDDPEGFIRSPHWRPASPSSATIFSSRMPTASRRRGIPARAMPRSSSPIRSARSPRRRRRSTPQADADWTTIVSARSGETEDVTVNPSRGRLGRIDAEGGIVSPARNGWRNGMKGCVSRSWFPTAARCLRARIFHGVRLADDTPTLAGSRLRTFASNQIQEDKK